MWSFKKYVLFTDKRFDRWVSPAVLGIFYENYLFEKLKEAEISSESYVAKVEESRSAREHENELVRNASVISTTEDESDIYKRHRKRKFSLDEEILRQRKRLTVEDKIKQSQSSRLRKRLAVEDKTERSQIFQLRKRMAVDEDKTERSQIFRLKKRMAVDEDKIERSQISRLRKRMVVDEDKTEQSQICRLRKCTAVENVNLASPRIEVSDKILSYIGSAYDDFSVGNIDTFIRLLKKSFKTRSRMSLCSMNEAVLQAIVENLLPSKCRIPELCLVIDGKKKKGFGRFGYSDIFILGKTGKCNICLELKYISLQGLLNQSNDFDANDLEIFDRILSEEDEEVLLNKSYRYWSKEHKKYVQTTIRERLVEGKNQLNMYINTIIKGQAIGYSASGVFDERIKVITGSTRLKGFVVMVIGFRRILWKPVKEITSMYRYNRVG